MKCLTFIILGLAANINALPLATAADQTVGLFRNDPGAFEGYTLFSPRHYHGTFLIDMEGELVHKWEHTNRVENAKLLPNGKLLRTVNLLHPNFRRIPGAHGRIELVNWDGSVEWFYEHVTDLEILHHDVIPLPNGNILMSVFQAKSKEEAIALGRNPQTLPTNRLIAEKIIEVKPTGKSGGDVIWSWSAWDHLIQDVDPDKPNYGKLSENPGRIDLNYVRRPTEDWNHVSGLDYNGELDLIMITLHGNDEVVIIDHSTTTEEAKTNSGGSHGQGGALLYRWGNPQTYGEGTANDRLYFAIHHAHWIPQGLPNAGKVLVLSNQYPGPNSEVHLVDIPMPDGNFIMPRRDSNTGQPAITVLYDDFHTRNMGGMQQLPNGNLLINDAVHGRFFEITPEKKIVWEYVNPVQRDGPLGRDETIPPNFSGDLLNECFRAIRIAPDHPALAGKDLSPKGVLEKPEGTVTVVQQAQQRPAGMRRPEGRAPPALAGRPGQGQMGRPGGMQGQQRIFHPTGLTDEEKAAYDAIMADSQSKRRNIFREARGDRDKMNAAMSELIDEQSRQVRAILNDEQYQQYLEWVDQLRKRMGGAGSRQRQ